MLKTDIINFINVQLEFTKKDDIDKIGRFQSQIAEGRSIRQAIEWGQEVVMHEISLGIVSRIERAQANGTGLIEMLEGVAERMTEDLLGNRYTQSSTSAFSRACEGAEAEATSRFLRTIKDWLRQYEWAD